jgi:AAA domain-containing protein/Toprim domain-containing protein
MSDRIDFAQHMAPVAINLLGQPNKREGERRHIWRYGRKQGSLVVDTEKGVWCEHDPKVSGLTKGGVLDLVTFKTGLLNGSAAEWINTEILHNFQTDFFDPLVFWRDGAAIQGTLGERYLQDERGIGVEGLTQDIVRFHPAHRANGKPETKAFPALIFPARNAAGKITGIQAVRLTPKGQKLAVAAKISGGVIKGSPLRAPGDRSTGITLVDGPEDMLTVRQDTGRECWASMSVSILSELPLPAGCPVTICMDRGSEESTRIQAEKLRDRGHPVRLATPPDGCKDPNDTSKHFGAAAVVRMLDQAEALELPNVERDDDLDDDLFPADPGPLNPDTAPPEEYLVGERLAVSFVSLLVAPGATMKTSLQLLQAVAAVTGRNLTGEQIHRRCRAWFVSNEEPIEVLRRRLWAICIQHNIDYENEVRPYLFVNSTVSHRAGFEVVRMQSGTVMVSPDVEKVIRFAKKAKIDLMMVDPFISTVGGASENDNTMIDFATRQFSHIAAVVPLALELAHHVAKSEDCEAHVGNIARARGAGSLVNKVRYSYTVAKTNDDTADKFGLSDDERRRLVRFDMGDKNNYVLPGGGPRWFKLESVELPNARDGRAASSVGVPVLYDMETRVPTVDPEIERRHNRIMDLLNVNIAGDDGRMATAAFVKILQQAAEVDPNFLTATSENSVRALISDVIPEKGGAYEKLIPGGKILLYRQKTGSAANAPIVLIKETIRG